MAALSVAAAPGASLWSSQEALSLCADGLIQLWHIDLGPTDVRPDWQQVRASLSPDEQQRAQAFLCPWAAWRFAATRHHLWQLLARHWDVRPAQAEIQPDAWGKPRLLARRTGRRSQPLPQFSLSHSHNRALIALSARQPVGVDLEAHNTVAAPALGPALMGSLHPAERLHLFSAAHPLGARRRLYALWTRKEAVVKALGCGLTRGVGTQLQQLCVLPAQHRGPLWVQGTRLMSLRAPPGFSAALALAE